MNVLIAPNSFKECDNSVNISKLILDNISKSFHENEINYTLKPVSDGGDGFLEVCKFCFDLELFSAEIVSPDGNGTLTVEYGVTRNGKTAYIESASIFGLSVVPRWKRAPLDLSSAGLGGLIKLISAKHSGVSEIIIGIGGTATNDLGLGALSELGVKLMDKSGNILKPFPGNLSSLYNLDYSEFNLPIKVSFVSDVNNSLLGENGATRIYGPQKGIEEDQIEYFEKLFENVISLSGYAGDIDKLSGAGGGVIAGFQLFSNVTIISSADFINKYLIPETGISPDLVITGEGMLDEQTFMNKGIKILLDRFVSSKFYIITGINRAEFKSDRVKIIELIKYFCSVKQSIEQFEYGISLACKEISEDILFDKKDA